MWVRSYWIADLTGWMRSGGSAPLGYLDYQANSVHGTLSFGRGRSVGIYPEWALHPWPVGMYWNSIPASRINAPEVLIGFRKDGRSNRPLLTYGFTIHYSLLILITSLPAFLWWRLLWRRRLRRVRVHEGRCVFCGYDLRESRGLCPECGQAGV